MASEKPELDFSRWELSGAKAHKVNLDSSEEEELDDSSSTSSAESAASWDSCEPIEEDDIV
jgi:hypothetical protein